MFEQRIKKLLEKSKESHSGDSYLYKFLGESLKNLDTNNRSCEVPALFNMDFFEKKLSEIDSSITAVLTERNTIKISI